MHRIDGDGAWLDTAHAGARYLIRVRDRGLATAELAHDHWLLYALAGLYRQRPEPEYVDHAMRIASAIVAAQRTGGVAPDYVGGFADVPRATQVATRAEGLMAAYALARHAGRDAQAQAILRAAERAAALQLSTQIDQARAMYLPNGQAAMGGFTGSHTQLEVRIDYVQHHLSALMALAEALEAGPSAMTKMP